MGGSPEDIKRAGWAEPRFILPSGWYLPTNRLHAASFNHCIMTDAAAKLSRMRLIPTEARDDDWRRARAILADAARGNISRTVWLLVIDKPWEFITPSRA